MNMWEYFVVKLCGGYKQMCYKQLYINRCAINNYTVELFIYMMGYGQVYSYAINI